MNVICLEDDAFYALVDKVIERISARNSIVPDKWISGEEAMQKLRITSKTTLQKLRDEAKIRFSVTSKKTILYDVDSINNFIELNAKNTF